MNQPIQFPNQYDVIREEAERQLLEPYSVGAGGNLAQEQEPENRAKRGHKGDQRACALGSEPGSHAGRSVALLNPSSDC